MGRVDRHQGCREDWNVVQVLEQLALGRGARAGELGPGSSGRGARAGELGPRSSGRGAQAGELGPVRGKDERRLSRCVPCRAATQMPKECHPERSGLTRPQE